MVGQIEEVVVVFRIFYWGIATAVKLMIIGLMYVAGLACLVYGACSIVFVYQFLTGFSVGLWGESNWLMLPIFGGLAAYIAILFGVVSVLLSLAGSFIVWGFKKDVTDVINLVR